MEHLTIGQLTNALLDIPADQRDQKVAIYDGRGGWVGFVGFAGFYDSTMLPSDDDNPFILEAIEDDSL